MHINNGFVSLRGLIITFLVFPFIIFTGCKDEKNPVTPEADHFEPEGWMILDSLNAPYMVVWQGTLRTAWNNSSVNDTFNIFAGRTTQLFRIGFLDAQKNLMNSLPDEDQSLGWVIDNTSLFEVIKDNAAPWSFRLKGLAAGTTNLELQVLHQGHADVKTPKIAVIVLPESSARGTSTGSSTGFNQRGGKK